MFKIKNYLLTNCLKYILINQSIILFLIIFLNLIELTRIIENDNKNIYSFVFLSILKIPTIINETSPFVVIISTAFLFRYLINYNELISMRNLGFSIFDIFLPITIGVLIYGLIILIFLNPLAAVSEIKIDKFLNNKNENTYSINFSENSLWIKNKSFDDKIYYINIEEFDLQKMSAKNINILSIKNNDNEFYHSKKGIINQKKILLNNVNYFDVSNDNYKFIDEMHLDLNFTKENILSSIINYKNIPYYKYINHIKTLKKFNLYTSLISLHYLSEILKPFFMILLSFVVMGFSAKYKRNESFFRVLFIAVLLGFLFFIFRELINKFTLSFDVNFIYSYLIIFTIPFLIGLYKVIQIEND